MLSIAPRVRSWRSRSNPADSSWGDLQRGIYQCVKYRAVVEAQEKEDKSSRWVRVLLVTESSLPEALDRTAKRLNVPHLQVAPVGR